MITTNSKDNEYIIIDSKDNDKFYKCKHGYIYSIPEYNVHQSQCKLNRKEVNYFCKDCMFFEEKR